MSEVVMKLVFPNLELKEQYYDLVKSALRNDDISEMGNAYRENEKYEDMLIRLENRSKGINISSRDVPATVQFILNEKGKVVGTIDIRHTLNDNYFSRLGHIAYYIKLEERNKGYATEALKLALEKLKNEYKVNKVLITCLKDNIASRKVIEANGGIFEKEFYDEITNNYIQRFWITF
jgi:predicted acetyltransferase